MIAFLRTSLFLFGLVVASPQIANACDGKDCACGQKKEKACNCGQNGKDEGDCDRKGGAECKPEGECKCDEKKEDAAK
jgi:hypothetical protein